MRHFALFLPSSVKKKIMNKKLNFFFSKILGAFFGVKWAF